MKIAETIKKARLKNKMSQAQLGKKLGYSSGQFVSNWERGASYPPMDRLAMMVNLFKLNKKEVLTLYIEEITASKINEFNSAFKKTC